MPAISVLSPEEWREVQTAVESGVTYEQAERQFGVDAQTIRTRAHRQKWMTPGKLEKAIEAQRLKRNEISPSEKPKALAVIANSRAENVEMLKDEGIKWGLKVVQNAGKSLTTPNSFADVKAAVDVAAKLAGIGNDSGSSVTVLFGGSPAALEARVVDVETVQADSVTDSQICDDLA